MLRRAGGGCHEASRMQGAQIESAAESIGERGEISGCIYRTAYLRKLKAWSSATSLAQEQEQITAALDFLLQGH